VKILCPFLELILVITPAATAFTDWLVLRTHYSTVQDFL